jgi:hypothetical protein
MEKGYISSRQIQWTEKKVSVWSIKGMMAENIVGSSPYVGESREAYRCTNCQIIIVKYGKTT